METKPESTTFYAKSSQAGGAPPSSDKIKVLETYIRTTHGAKNGHAARFIALANDLFGRSANTFLEQRSVEQLDSIICHSAAALDKLVQGQLKILIEAEQKRSEYDENGTSLYILLPDRPFIINTVTQTIQDFGVQIYELLLPIINQGGNLIALTYVELEPITSEQLQLLIERLTQNLGELIGVTDHFPLMLEQLDTVARSVPASTEAKEISDFLRWLSDGGSIILGYGSLQGSEVKNGLGFLRGGGVISATLTQELLADLMRLRAAPQPLFISKLRTCSPIHRRKRILSVLIPAVEKGAVHCFLILLSSRAISQEAGTIPVIRRKLQYVLDSEGALPHSHLYKHITSVFDGAPRDEALYFPATLLLDDVRTVLGVHNKDETKVSVRFDAAQRGGSVLVILPKDRFSSRVQRSIQEHVEQVFGAAQGSSEYHVPVTQGPGCRFYLYVPLSEGNLPEIDLRALQHRILELARTWKDNLRDRLLTSSRFEDRERVWLRYAEAFSNEYQALQSVEDAELDIYALEGISAQQDLKIGMAFGAARDGASVTLITYHRGREITISQALPVLENLGLEVISERVFRVHPRQSECVYIQRFLVKSKHQAFIDSKLFNEIFAPGLVQILKGQAEDDALNTLFLSASLDTFAILMLRSYSCLLNQITPFISKAFILETLAAAPAQARALWEIFRIRFDPKLELSKDVRAERQAKSATELIEGLRSVTDITRDRVLRTLLSLVENSVRTNFFKGGNVVAFKIASHKVEAMPQPRPRFEVFIYSPDMEGVHLRSSMVARGGIRWSDRKEDYRTEVLGLQKTQTIKNVVIVPQGAKGGFIVKNLPQNKNEIAQAVQQAYRQFICALLSLTDNRRGTEITPPPDLIVHDESDPYLVVAADKGTATFSDTANRIAVDDFNFWLGDAFASGGSNGYDHKLYAITAKGAWQCVKRHFNELGLNYEKQPFSVVGIGDMSGDVFGNGMLLSPNIKLVAAFNHKHIFIDPNPDVSVSFKERERLFRMPGSEWLDYDRKLLSEGGGVYGRFDKEINLSPQGRCALGIAENEPARISGEDLIRYILKAPCDLLWNGGIGTYVKSRNESHSDVNDSTNDRVRVNSDELRVLAVGEGGNLGFTQRARIDFARRGGRINTDAIDNSGGVDLSDHEVNLKILLDSLIKEGKLTLPERNKMLLDMAPDVIEAVLEHNANHAVALTFGVMRSKTNIDYFRSLITELVQLGYINRGLESLPDDDELAQRSKRKEGLTRPELAVCLAGMKMVVKQVLINSALSSDPLLKDFLIDYFPCAVRDKYREQILAHPLAPNIIATQVTNALIDAVGISFIHRMCVSYSVPPVIVIKCLLAAKSILATRDIRRALRQFDNYSKNALFLEMALDLGRTLRDATAWLISNHGHELSLDQMVQLYQKPYATLLAEAEKVLGREDADLITRRAENYRSLGFSDKDSRNMSLFPIITSIFEMLWTARESRKPVPAVVKIYSQVVEELGINTLLGLEKSIETNNKWESELLTNSMAEIRRGISTLALNLTKAAINEPQAISKRLRECPSYARFSSTLRDCQENALTVSALSVVARQLRMYQL